jgi:hypothetical protein
MITALLLGFGLIQGQPDIVIADNREFLWKTDWMMDDVVRLPDVPGWIVIQVNGEPVRIAILK